MSDSSMYIILLSIMFVLLCLTSFFSFAETALTSINLIRIKSIAKNSNNDYSVKKTKQAKRVYRFVKDYNRTLMTILLGNTMANTGLATIGAVFIGFFIQEPTISMLVSTFGLGICILIIGEVLPKTIAKSNPEKICMFLSRPIIFFIYFLYPFTWLITLIKITRKDPSATEKELLELLKTIESEGVIESAEKNLIESAIKFDDKKVGDIMIPIKKVSTIDINSTFADFKKVYNKSHFSRVPVSDSSNGNIVGFVNVKNILNLIIGDDEFDPSKIMSECVYVDFNDSLDKVLKVMQSERVHIASVITKKSKNNKALGIITFEDLIEEIVGQVYDEKDHIGQVVDVGNQSFHAEGNSLLSQIFPEKLKIEVPEEFKNKTLYSWFADQIHITNENEINDNSELVYKNYLFTIKKYDKNKQKIIFEIEKLLGPDEDKTLIK
ncbi:hemolysin family protein [Spiroplasma endosymbiont of Amphibalanus improvisus]|uniref:hemolysin family protein n=1 Tax=Spiroplasma endosymbiont of Amphibalanus improvisus TaxID=3066327 RepID=UPI00313E8A04